MRLVGRHDHLHVIVSQAGEEQVRADLQLAALVVSRHVIEPDAFLRVVPDPSKDAALVENFTFGPAQDSGWLTAQDS